jgi:signal peptidase II
MLRASQGSGMFLLLTYASITLLTDQLSKRAVQARLGEPLPCGHLLQIREVHHHPRMYDHALFRASLVLIWFLAAASAFWLQSTSLFLYGRLAMAGVGCALGGAAGNLADILRRRHVVDFIDLGWWPVFNLADVGIVVGLLLAFLSMVLHA